MSYFQPLIPTIKIPPLAGEKEQIKRCQKDHREFATLYLKYHKKIYHYLRYRLQPRNDIAEELTQETFARAFRALDRFHPQRASYLSYLRVIAHHLLVNFYRSKAILSLEKIEFKLSKEMTLPDPFSTLKLWQAVNQLSRNEKKVILLKYKKDQTIQSIASAMGKTTNAIKLLLYRARKKLKSLTTR